MKLSNCIERDWIRCGLEAEDRGEAYRKTISSLPDGLREEVESILFDERGDVAADSFTAGNGVAFPHARTDQVSGIKTAVGLFPDGVTFEENGTEKVRVLVLFLFAEKRSGLYLKFLSAFSSVFESDVHVENVAKSGSPQSLISYLNATGSKVLGDFSLHDLVRPPEQVLRSEDSMKKALEALCEGTDDRVPVVDEEGRLLGRVTHAGLVNVALRDYGASVTTEGSADLPDVFSNFLSLHGEEPVKSIMEPGMVTIDESSSLFEATAKLVQSDLTSAPVTSDDRLVGVFRLSEWTDKILRFGML